MRFSKKDDRSSAFTTIWLILALSCILYGIIVSTSGAGTGFFFIWLVLGALFIILFFLARKGIWGRLSVVLKKLIIGLTGIGLAIFCIIEGFVISGFMQHGEDELDYIIVLGAQVYKNGPSIVLRYRLDEAIDYLNNNPGTVCIVTGGQGYNEPFAEAVGMAEYLEKNGIDSGRIILETKSKNTKQNIENSMKLIREDSSVGIVTNNFHVFRALQTAKSLGLTDVCGIAADSAAFYLPNNMLREFLAEIKFLLLILAGH